MRQNARHPHMFCSRTVSALPDPILVILSRVIPFDAPAPFGSIQDACFGGLT